MERVIVLGAGLAGLGFCRELPDCQVFEAAPHVGGHAWSHALGGAWFDQGAHICHSKDTAFRALVMQAAGRVHDIAPSVVGNYWRDRWMTYPVQNNLHELPLPLRAQALVDLLQGHLTRCEGAAEPADYRAWCLAQYGRTLTEQFYDVFTRKYWRVGAEELATDWLGGRLLPSQLARVVRGAFAAEAETQAAFVRFHYPSQGGFFEFFRRLYDDMPVTCGSAAVELDAKQQYVIFTSGRREAFGYLASSMPLPALVGITRDVPAELRAAAGKLRHTQLLCVNLIVDRPRLTNCHWFYVYDPDIEAARVSVPTNLAPGSLPDGRTALQAEVFRRDDEPMPIAALVERTVAQLGRLLHFGGSDIRVIGHHHVPRAYILSDRNRGPAVAALRSWFEERGVYTMGLYGRWQYVWSDEAFRQGRETALQIKARAGARKSA
jgi:protoporphyrinogen oxidase